jgi:serine/threonine protein kinase
MEDTSVIGQYSLIDKLKGTSRNNVYLAVKSGAKVRTPVVLKVPSPEGIVSLRQEAEILAKLRHENICSLIEFNSALETPFLVLEYADGVSLEDIIGSVTSRGATAPNLMLGIQIVYQVAQTLNYLAKTHEFSSIYSGQIAHGGLSPKNIIVTFDGQVKLIDFGCARVMNRTTDLSIAVATVRYTSPSRAKEQRIDMRDDLFALGLMLWELSTGTRYWGDFGNEEIMNALREFTPRDPSSVLPALPVQLSKIVLPCIQEEYFKGYASVEDFINDLVKFHQNLGGEASPIELGPYVRANYPVQLQKSRRLLQRMNRLSQTNPEHTAPQRFWEKTLERIKRFG